MVRSLLLMFTLLLFGSAAFSQTILQGEVSDEIEPLIGASIKILKGTEFVRGTQTDTEGKYRVQLDPGRYDLEVSYTGYTTQRITGVQVLVGQLNKQDVRMQASESGELLGVVDIVEYTVPLIKQDQTQGGQTLTSDQIKNLPTRSVNTIVATTAGTSSVDGGEVSIKGSRPNATNYYVDGIRVYGNQVPTVQDIEQLQVVTGGLGAEYGDVTGGVISVTTKGPASQFSGGIDVENSHGLDPYGWLLATANISGPLIKRKSADGKSERTLVGFRLSGQYNSQLDDDPPAVSVHRAKGKYLGDDAAFGSQFEEGSTMDILQQHPLKRVNGVVTSRAETYTNDSVDVMKYRPFEGRRDIDGTGKLDFRLTDNIDISLTGTYKNVENQFTPGDWGDNNWMLLNSHNNPTQYDQRYRVLGRFRHRLGSGDGAAASNSKFAVSNASYQLQMGFERANSRVYDPRHGDRLFDYGYVGQFNFDYIPTYRFDPDQQILIHEDYAEIYTGHVASNINPGLVAFNEFSNPEDYDSYIARNGRFSNLYNGVWSGMHGNVNRVYNRNSKSESDFVTIQASTNFDLKLGKTGVHNIQFGLLNEQRTLRDWVLAPSGLWEIARQQANKHFNGIDSTRIARYDSVMVNGVTVLVPIYNNLIDAPDDGRFYSAVRESLGLTLDDYVNAQGLTPDQLRLDMFSSFELTEVEALTYYGYDYLGNKLDNSVTFNDFFTSGLGTETGRTFPVAPLRPLYQAAFLKDKFTFNKMIFSLGLRVERFDLNTKVMRDQYSLYEIMDAQTYYAQNPEKVRPGGISDDYKVYTVSGQDNSVKAFRSGDVWYTNKGIQVNDANVIFGGGVINPLLKDEVAGGDIRSESFNPNTSFEDYTPQVNWLPRMAFSFPISDDANFFAHYDVLVQRPPDNWQVTPLNYYYFYTPDRTPSNNANLRPEKVVDYEVGFQQKLNDYSALKFSAYYREMRDMIQQRIVNYVPVIGRYTTVGNEDFGTVKGFTVQYDLRRIQNAELRLAYTLQFAEGTGSNSTSQRGLRQNLRVLYPLDFDERHNLNAVLDYRFDEGKKYTGPVLWGKDILANFGANLQMGAVSGRPYTARLRASRFGGEGTASAINGNRLPWRFTIDLRLDKSFTLTKNSNLNIYFRVSNLLNRRNWLSVYPFTGSPYDDGYLATAEGQSIVNGIDSQGKDVNAYLASYSWVLLDPNRFSLPRRIYVGASVSF